MCFRPALKPNRKTTETQLVAILDRPKPDRLLVLIIAEGEKNQSRKKKGNYNEFLEKKTSPFYP